MTIRKWSGGNWSDSYADFLTSRTGLTMGTPITLDLLASPAGLKLMKAQAQWEAGKPYPMTDSEWQQAQSMVFRGTPRPVPPPIARPKPPTAAPQQRSLLSIIIGAVAAIFKGK